MLFSHGRWLFYAVSQLKIRYEYYNNCNFTEIGEPFAEQPYAIAVQQGSHLQEEISKVIKSSSCLKFHF